MSFLRRVGGVCSLCIGQALNAVRVGVDLKSRSLIEVLSGIPFFNFGCMEDADRLKVDQLCVGVMSLRC